MLVKNKWGIIFVWTGVILLLFSVFFKIMSEALYSNTATLEREVDIIAHRGLPLEAPENSLLAVEKAIEKDCKFIEIDVHQTADGAIVLLHDFTLNRTTTLKGLVKNYTLQELQEYNDQIRTGLLSEGAEIPLLKDVLKRVNGKANLLVEVKAGGDYYPGIEASLVKMIQEYNAHSWVQVNSFNDEVLENIHAADPQIEIHKLLLFYFPLINLMVDEGVHFRKLKTYNYVSRFSIYYPFANRRFIKMAHDLDKKVNIWSLNNNSKALKYVGLGVDGIITDKADYLLNPEQNNKIILKL